MVLFKRFLLVLVLFTFTALLFGGTAEMTKIEAKKNNQFLTLSFGDEEKAFNLFLQYKCLTDLYFLGSKILGLEAAKEGKRSRLDPKFHRWLSSKLSDEEDTLLLVPRDHMKSTWMKVRVVQLILQRPNIRIGLFSRTAKLAEDQLQDIKNHLRLPLLRRLFPDIIPEPGKYDRNWQKSNASELTLCRDRAWERIPQENQVEAWGAGATITGRHYDVIILDDILNELSCSTLEQIRKTIDWYAYVQSIKEPTGLEYIVGTRYHFSDPYGKIIKEKWFGSRTYVRGAIEDGRPNYSFFTMDILTKLKTRMGRYKFSCQYINDPLPEEDKIFPAPQPFDMHLPADEYMAFGTLDPAATTEVYSDESGIAVGLVNKAGQLYVPEGKGYKLKSNEIADLLLAKIIRYKPKKVGIELGLQTALKYILDLKISEHEQKTEKKLGIEIVRIQIPRTLSKADRVNNSMGSFVREKLAFPNDDLKDLCRLKSTSLWENTS